MAQMSMHSHSSLVPLSPSWAILTSFSRSRVSVVKPTDDANFKQVRSTRRGVSLVPVTQKSFVFVALCATRAHEHAPLPIRLQKQQCVMCEYAKGMSPSRVTERSSLQLTSNKLGHEERDVRWEGKVVES